MLSVLYVTCPDEQVASDLSRALVDKHLAACTNWFPIRSVYRWEGELVEEAEVGMYVKTRPDLVDDATAFLLEAHPYDTPCVVDLGVAAVNDAYGAWVEEETAKAGAEGTGAATGPDAGGPDTLGA